MEIIWDPRKQEKLLAERTIDLQEIKALIQGNCFFDILEHPAKRGQYFIPLKYKSYVHIVVVKIENDRMIIKTCYPSRKAERKYSRSQDE